MNHRTKPSATGAIALAMLAVSQHAVDHGLTLWRLEYADWHPDRGIAVAVDRPHLDAWLDTVTVQGDPDVRRGTGENATIEMVSHPALLPTAIGDVRITITSSRTVTVTPLQLVGSAS